MTAAATSRVLAYRRLLLIAGLVLALDQATKAWIEARLPYGTYGAGSIPLLRGFLYLVHVGNTGAAWSLFTGSSLPLAVLAAATLAAIVVWRRALGLVEPAVQTSFGLLCGGIVGNLADRVRLGHVVDFIDVHFGRWAYPTFNVADSGICIGVALYLLHSLRPRGPR